MSCSMISVDQTSKAGRSRLSAELVRVAMELARQQDGDDYFELDCFPNRVSIRVQTCIIWNLLSFYCKGSS